MKTEQEYRALVQEYGWTLKDVPWAERTAALCEVAVQPRRLPSCLQR
jgi:hypothetical protein